MNENNGLVEVEELRNATGKKIAKGTIYAAIKRGEIPSVTVGRRVFIPRWFLDQILNPPAGHGK